MKIPDTQQMYLPTFD